MTKYVEIKNHRPRIYTVGKVSLHPGLNTLTKADADELLKHPHTKIKQDRGFIEVIGAKKQPAKAAVKPAADAEAKAAAKADAEAKAKVAADAKAAADKEAAEAEAAQQKADAEKAEADAAAAAEAEAQAAADAAADAVDAFEEPPYGIAGLSADDSIAKIKVIEDVEYLKVVAGREDRKTVSAAAEKRVAELESK